MPQGDVISLIADTVSRMDAKLDSLLEKQGAIESRVAVIEQRLNDAEKSVQRHRGAMQWFVGLFVASVLSLAGVFLALWDAMHKTLR
jgi:hypothetical protein